MANDQAALPILVVEDDESIGRPLSAALRGQGYDVLWALSAAEALELAGAEPPVLVLLDLGLPDLDGVELCRQLRVLVPAAIIVVLSARADDVDVVLGLEAGADDYLTKPFRLPVLLARIRAHLRRQTPAPASQGTSDVVNLGQLRLDLGARRCEVGGQEVPLRPKEFDLLAALVAEAGHAVTREHLMSDVWDEHWSGSTKTLDMHVSSLRRKLAEHGEDPNRIVTLRGYGYRYDPAVRVVPGRTS
ncbi:MAG TPA: response regulator transcription factor [Kineosporiaceae bacterium]|nr:response regulator transcription factor [Kineosporiaceae bacterium]